MSQPFAPTTQPFIPGIVSIEASAGTGKTFSIAYLVLRMVVELGIPIEQILTVTFTKAATEELKERIRAQLYRARLAFAHDTDDKLLAQWVASRSASADEDIKKLNQALVNIDLAGVFTIHGFCQRVLSEFPLESQQGFVLEMGEDASELKKQLVYDFWRTHIYPLNAAQAQIFNTVISSPDELYDWLDAVGQSEIELVPAQSASWADTWTALDPAFASLEQWFAQKHTDLAAWLHEREASFLKQGKTKMQDLASHYMDFCHVGTFLNMLSGTKFKDSKTGTKASKMEQFWEEFVEALDPPIYPAGIYLDAYPNLEVSLKHACYEYYRSTLYLRQEEQGQLGFDDLILRLADVVNHEQNGAHIKRIMQARFAAVLIDEFQDTDAEQWQIFQGLFATDRHYMYLIGDPKQAIYKFRGADIDTYIQAVKSADQHLTLGQNWRSTPNLIAATNAVFSQIDNPFGRTELPFQPVAAGKIPKPDEVQLAQPMRFWSIAPHIMADNPNAEQQKRLVMQHVCADILHKLQSHVYRPEQMAIIVRANHTAKQYQAMLNTLHIPAVIKAKDSVFSTDEAMSIHRLLNAMLQPSRLSLVKAALAEPLFSPTIEAYLQAVDELADDDKLANLAQDLSTAHLLWQQKSVLTAVMFLLKRHDSFANLGRFVDAERRITNIRHILELLQEQVLEDALSPIQTLQYLEEAMQSSRSEQTELRLESDADALQIVTIHSSKGLQYPVVYCPDLYHLSDKPLQANVYRIKQGDKWLANVNQEGRGLLAEQMQQDLYAEDIRLVYVALTRAERETIVLLPPQVDKPKYNSLGVLLPNGAPPSAHIVSETISGVDWSSLGHYQPELRQYDERNVLRFTRQVDTRYRMTSFSGLTHAPLESALGKAEDEILEGGDAQKVSSAALTEPDKTESIDHHSYLPKGAHFGNLLHDVLEHQAFAELAEQGCDHELLIALSQRYGVSEMMVTPAAAPTALSEVVLNNKALTEFNQLIVNTVTAPLELGSNIALKDIGTNDVLKEMPFYMSLHEADTVKLNQLMQQHGAEIPYQPLAYRDLVGHMNGFIDLIAHYDGRFYVMDYKSNFIAEGYGHEAMHHKMLHANYGLQGVLYTLALHRYLRQHLPNYSFATHMGGVRYLFCRGMSEGEHEQGVYRYNPSEALIMHIDRLFSGEVQ